MTWNAADGPIPPMLAIPHDRPFDSPRHFFELKWDGYRAIAFLDQRTRLQSRRLRDITGEFPELGRLNGRLVREQATLDGEIVAMRDGKPDFQSLQHRRGPAVFVVFDILSVDGQAVIQRPLSERKELLASAVREGEGLVVAAFFPREGKALFRAATVRGLEGIVAKDADSPYVPGGRTSHWLKVKVRRTVDCVIGGVLRGVGGPLGSLALGLYCGPDLLYVGNVGTGFSEEEREALVSVLEFSEEAPFRVPGRRLPPELRGALWVKPDRVCEVSYTEMTDDFRLRHPSYLRLRGDKLSTECTFRQLGRELGTDACQ